MAEGQSSMSTRWNPTREQIALLEALYSQGIRTPKADQIEQIASRLRMYGNIEGKNVFYWFQNHKARERQRQKQKEERVASINQFLQPPSFVGTPHTNGYFPIQPQSAVVESSLPENFPIQQQSAMVMRPKKQVTADDNEPPTLELFPLHPTGIAIYKSRKSVCNPEYRSEPVNLSLCSPDENGDEQNDARDGSFVVDA